MTRIKVVMGVAGDGDRYFLARRAAGVEFPRFWCFPGGKIEEGETPRDALRRELQEEVGAAVYDVDVGAGPCFEQVYDPPVTGKPVHIVGFAVSARALREARPLDGTTEVGWFSIWDALGKLDLTPASLSYLQGLAAHRVPTGAEFAEVLLRLRALERKKGGRR